jgi:chromosome segregation ATPase
VISLEQVRALEDRVEKAVAYISSLREEGAELGRRLAEAQSFIDDAANELSAAEAKLSASEAKAEEAVAKLSAAEARAEAAEAQRQSDLKRVREVEAALADMSERVAAAETKAAELSSRAEEYRKDQAKIEEGIVHALEKLDSFEDLVLGQGAASAKAVVAAKTIATEKSPSEETAVKAPVEEPKPETEGVAVKAEGEGSAGIVENELDIF